MTVYLEPIGLLHGIAAQRALDDDDAVPLAGGPIAFTHLHRIVRDGGSSRTERMTVAAARALAADDPAVAATLDRLSAPRPDFAGLDMAAGAAHLMGIVNVTPDSFSDGGRFFDPAVAIAHAHGLVADGAAIVDIGGESTRPGAEPVPPDEELARVLPVIAALGDLDAPVSIDTRHAAVMAAALDAGAAIVNDVTALAGDPAALTAMAACDAPIVLMHMAGEPRTMQDAPRYDDVVLDVFDALAARITACEAAGIARSRLAVDPGIGFGKTLAHNLELLDRLALFHGLGCPLLVGASRKRFVGRVDGDAPADRRLGGSIAAALAAQARGCQVLRVHDVAETRQAVRLAARIAAGETPESR